MVTREGSDFASERSEAKSEPEGREISRRNAPKRSPVFWKEKSRVLEGIESTLIKSIIRLHFSISHVLYQACRWKRFLRSEISSEDVGEILVGFRFGTVRD